jgi:hypothetical protein
MSINALSMVVSFKIYQEIVKLLRLFAVKAEINFEVSTKMAGVPSLQDDNILSSEKRKEI